MSRGIHPTASIHPTAVVDEPVSIGANTRIWHFCHVMSGAEIGDDCILGQNCFVAATAIIGHRVKVQNNVSVYDGVVLEDEVFCGPSLVFTNVNNPRSAISRKSEYQQTLVGRGATLGANATITPGASLGEFCFVAAGAVVCQDIRAYELVAGVPAVHKGWMSRHGSRLDFEKSGIATCPGTGERYRLTDDGVVLLRSDTRA
jgi:UDP-2-acetamido-3-amino-2,3-dideoxy-glucuronate N-acetyltransferase